MNNINLQTKIIISFSIVMFVMVISFGLYISLYFMKIQEDRIIENIEELTSKFTKQIDYYMRDLTQSARNLAYEPGLIEQLKIINQFDDINDYDLTMFDRNIGDTIARVVSLNSFSLSPNIAYTNIYVYSKNMKYKYSFTSTSVGNLEKVLRDKLYQNDLEKDKFTIYCSNSNTSQASAPNYSIIIPIMDNLGNLCGYLEIIQDNHVLDEIFNVGSLGKCIIIDKYNNIVYLKEPLGDKTLTFLTSSKTSGGSYLRDSSNNYFFHFKSVYSQWHVFIQYTTESLFAPLNTMKFANYIFIFVLLILSLMFIYYFSRILTTPIIKLRDEILKVNGSNMEFNFDGVSYNNEIEMLNKAFQDMLFRLKESVQSEITAHKEEAKARFSALQAQMSPHFIHNVLYLISISIRNNKGDDAVKMCKQLSNMLRYIVNSPFSTVTLEEEISYMWNYLSLQEKSYGDAINYSIDLQESIKLITLPRLVIQPFVENAIQHGFIKCKPPWKISISCIEKNDSWVIIISDNGIGIKPDKLDEIWEKISGNNALVTQERSDDTPGMCSMGIVNTVMRLKLLYGEELSFDICSNNGSGTTVSISGPIKPQISSLEL
ncbi:two-component system sensor histidine kinase YesM [Anaerobacterium chartisolvens]|uniref:Two-component system sensor histidine kinase YesM n=1 Tax=Anaerobacterium chartisolvens TaxID=1297424 RepID=A0A369AUD7_9FIRM|nr:histidine kinase [Anaerobacterium chartisolvens]RCX12990.1 two-component system sensor histidine kinase YesM [Anaerobacterium chartisolvens]